ncbi:MAG: enolase C-terminal domain-like protein [Candidatus Latescibacterota bacterium]
MKITKITLHLVNVPETHWWWSDDEHGQPGHQCDEHFVAEVETDDGFTGLTQIERMTAHTVVEETVRGWLGTDVLRVNLAQRPSALCKSFEQAVLDLRGQALGVPVWQLLGGRLRDRVPITMCTGYKTPEHTGEQAAAGWEQGFRWYKMKCCTGRDVTPEDRLRHIENRVRAIHEAAPGMGIRPDIRWRLEEVWVAQELAHRLDGLPMESFESPITKGAYAGSYSEWRRLRQTIRVPIGDHASDPEDLLRRVQAEALDYAIIGSDSHLVDVQRSQFVHALGLGGWSQCVQYGPGAAMGLHVAACMPHLSQPYDMVGPMAWEHDLTNEPFELEGGALLVPDRPGLGFTLDHDAVNRYLINRHILEAE